MTWPASPQIGEGPGHKLWHALCVINGRRPLGDIGEEPIGLEVAVARLARRRGVREAQNRRRVLEGLTDSAGSILEACGVYLTLQGANAEFPAVGQAGESVGQSNAIAFIPHHNEGHSLFTEGVVQPTRWEE